MINVFSNDQMISGMTKVDDLTVCVWESGRICIDSDFLSQFSTILTLMTTKGSILESRYQLVRFSKIMR